MSFRNEAQQIAVCRALLSRVGRARLFDAHAHGPTREAVRLLKNGEGSSSEALMLRVAFDVWNGRGDASLGRCLHVFDNANMGAITTMMQAVCAGPEAVDRWLARFEPREGVQS